MIRPNPCPAILNAMPASDQLIDRLDLHLPDLPAALEGLRIAHVTDLHIGRQRRRHDEIIGQLNRQRPDMIVLTGDYMNWPGTEAVALEVMRRLCDKFNAPLGHFGVFGNHDTANLRAVVESLPVVWLNDAGQRVGDLPLEIWGADTEHKTRHHNAVTLAEALAGSNGRHDCPPDYPSDSSPNRLSDQRPIRLLLCHMPGFLPTAADLRMDVMLSGHTHGGQCRLPGARALVNSSDFPLGLTSGLLHHRGTLCAVSRGLGEILLPIRMFCRPHLPIYTLCRGANGAPTPQITNIIPW